jgi:hypothetical protein
MKDLKERLLVAMPISLDDVGEIRHITIKDVLEIGEEKLGRFLGALSITKDHLDLDEEVLENLGELSNIEIACVVSDDEFQKTLVEAVSFFTGESAFFN